VAYQRAIQADRKSAVAYQRLAVTKVRLNEPYPALDSLTKALDLMPAGDPGRVPAQVLKSDLYVHYYVNSDTLDEVDRTAHQLIERNLDFDGHRLLGEIALIRADWCRTHSATLYDAVLKDSLIQLELADRAKPGQLKVMILHARALAANGRLSEAEQIYRAAIRTYPQSPDVYAEVYRLLLAQDKPNEAQEILRSAAMNVGDCDWFPTTLAAQELTQKDTKGLGEAVRLLKAKSSKPQAVCLAAGDFWVRAGDADSALREYQACGSADAQTLDLVHRRMVRLLSAAGRQQQAKQVNEQILATHPKDVEARAMEGVMDPNADRDRAMAVLETAAIENRQDYELIYYAARMHLLNSEFGLARQQVSAVLELRPDYVPGLIMLAQIQFHDGDYRMAAASVTRALAASPREPHLGLMQAILVGFHDGLPTSSELQTAAQRIGQGQYELAADHLERHRRASGSGAPNAPPFQTITNTPVEVSGVYLSNSLADEAISRFSRFREKPKHPFDLALPVAGLPTQTVQQVITGPAEITLAAGK
jgi:tetratricopeptide (TPR) repeat protein